MLSTTGRFQNARSVPECCSSVTVAVRVTARVREKPRPASLRTILLKTVLELSGGMRASCKTSRAFLPKGWLETPRVGASTNSECSKSNLEKVFVASQVLPQLQDPAPRADGEAITGWLAMSDGQLLALLLQKKEFEKSKPYRVATLDLARFDELLVKPAGRLRDELLHGLHFKRASQYEGLFPPSVKPRPRSTFSRADAVFIDAEIETGLQWGLFKELAAEPAAGLMSIFVAWKDDKGRLILNGKPMKHIYDKDDCSFKLEALSLLPQILREGDFCTVADVKRCALRRHGMRCNGKPPLNRAYYAAPVDDESAELLNFAWQDADGAWRFFQYTVPPFGQRPSGAAFNRPMSLVMQHLRDERHVFATWDVRIVRYMDDFLLAANDFRTALLATLVLTVTLSRLGYVVAWDKSQLLPSQGETEEDRVKFLGFHVCTRSLRFLIPEQKLCDFEARAKKVIEAGGLGGHGATKREVASLLGLANCFAAACKQVRRFLWSLYETLAQKTDWDEICFLSDLKKQCKISTPGSTTLGAGMGPSLGKRDRRSFVTPSSRWTRVRRAGVVERRLRKEQCAAA